MTKTAKRSSANSSKKLSQAVQRRAIQAVDRFVGQFSKKPKPKTKQDMIDILRDLYKGAYAYTDTFERQHVGADLAYLMGAIVSENFCVWSHDRPLVKLLRKVLPPDHRVWEYIILESE